MALDLNSFLEPDGPPINQIQKLKSVSVGEDDLPNITVVREPADLGTPVGGYYQLSAGKYIFNTAIDWGTDGIDCIDSNSVYVFDSPTLDIQTYTGTGAFIKSTGTGNIVFIKEIGITAPNGTAVEMIGTGGGSILTEKPLILGCQKAFNLKDIGFFTVESVAMVACDDGITADGVDVAIMYRMQWSSGTDSGGTAYEALGASSTRLVSIGLDTEATATESIFDIQATYGGNVSITGGVNSSGDFFKTGSRDQTDIDIKVLNVSNVQDSKQIGAVTAQDNNTQTIINTATVYEDLKLNASFTTLDSTEEFTLTNTTTGELRYDGNEDFSGNIMASISAVGAGAANEYRFRVAVNGVQVNGVTANEISGTMSSTTLITPIMISQNDLIKVQVANQDGISNITIRFITIDIQ